MRNRFFANLLHGADYNYEQWLDYPEILDKDFEYMKQAGCNVMTIGVFSWAKLEPAEGEFDFAWMDGLMDRLADNGIKAILATPSGSKPAWMSQKYPEICRVAENGTRGPHGGRHNHCRTSPVYRDKCVTINTKLAERYKDHPALLMWHASNEYNAGYCHCELCLNAFRQWLKKRYGSLETLNKAWWTTFWSHTYTSWDQVFPGDKSVHGLTLDWQRFTSDQTMDFYLAESAPLREITPQVPVTTNFMMPNVGLDYFKFAKHIDIVSWDNYPRWHTGRDEWKEGVKASFYHDIFRSLKDGSFMMMESSPNVTNWQGTSVPKKNGMHLLSSLQAIAHGSDTVQYFQWRQSRGGEEKFHGAAIGHAGHNDTRVFRDVTSVGKTLEKLSAINGAEVRAEVAIIYDLQSEWALDNAQLPNNLDKNYQTRCLAHYRAFWGQGVPVDIRDCSTPAFDRYKIVIAPSLYMLREGFEDKIKRFVSEGGIFVATCLTGLVNESDLCLPGGAPGPLRQILGVWIEDTDTICDWHSQSFTYKEKKFPAKSYADLVRTDGADVLARFERGSLEDLPAVTVNKFGEGRAYYLASRSEGPFYDNFYAQLTEELLSPALFTGNLPEGTTVQRRTSDNTEFSFWMNFTDIPQTLTGIRYHAVDMLSGDHISEKLTVPGYGVRILKRDIDG